MDNHTFAFRDASDLGILKITGDDTLDLLNRMSTNSVLDVSPFTVSHTILTNDKGRIIDIVYIANFVSHYLLITSAGRDQLVLDWLDKYTIMEDIEYENITTETSIFHVLHENPLSIFPNRNTNRNLPQAIDIISNQISCTLIPYTLGSLPSYLLISSTTNHDSMYKHLSNNLVSWDPETYEDFRIANKIPLSGKELSENHNPLEAGLIGAIDFHKGCYIGQEVIARLDTYDKVQTHLSFVEISSSAHYQSGQQLFHKGKLAGSITSSQHPKTDTRLFGMAYIHKNYSNIGTSLVTAQGEEVLVLETPLFFGEER
tara:strand:- start:21551 stop:22495 length:945 start_codon:yes stop_codon:yes gene_type:complete